MKFLISFQTESKYSKAQFSTLSTKLNIIRFTKKHLAQFYFRCLELEVFFNC